VTSPSRIRWNSPGSCAGSREATSTRQSLSIGFILAIELPSLDLADEPGEEFALRYFAPSEDYSRKRMGELGIPEGRIGAYDIDFDFRHAAFFPKERTGGENSPGARINLNSGVLNPKLLASRFGPEGAELWERGRLRDRIDAVIVHEDIEGLKVVENQGFEAAHTAALIQGPETTRPITESARNILRAMTEHGKPSE
jgi:hypothetical protein